VLELYPGTKLGVGPAIESGFYYDFERETPFTTEDLELIEKKMRSFATVIWPTAARSSPNRRASGATRNWARG